MAKKKVNNLHKVIRPVETIVKTGKPLDNNKIITPDDVMTPPELSNLLDTKSQTRIPILPVVNKNSLSLADTNTLLSEETVRRAMHAERVDDIQQAKEDEMKRRELVIKEVQLKRDEFQLFLKKEYVEIVGEKQIKNGTEDTIGHSIELRRRELEQGKLELKDAIVDRLEREHRRKTQEGALKVNKVTTNQTFFETEFKTEYEEKLLINPEIEGLTDIELTKKQISELEKTLDRKIIPHRDMMETENGVVFIKERVTPKS